MAAKATAERVRENRVRRMAERQGLALRKSRRRDPYAIDYGTYWLIDPSMNAVTHECGNLDEVEEWLTRPE